MSIRAIQKSDYDKVKEIINKAYLQNVYLSIDLTMYGFMNNNVNTYLAMEDGEISIIAYFYYQSAQLFEVRKPSVSLISDLVELLKAKQIVRVSGKTSLVKQLAKYMNCEITDGYIMEYVDQEQYGYDDTCFAKEEDLKEIAQLICMDNDLGKEYTVDGLSAQLSSRMKLDGCRNLIIKNEGKIVSHFASYAETKDMAVLSGMITRSEYRNCGYGSKLVRELSSLLKMQEKKNVFLYCYQDVYYSWYQKLGYVTVGESSKMIINY